MKNKKLLALAASAALIANLALGVASAETTTSDQQINGGSLTIVSTPATLNFSNLNVSTASQNNKATYTTNSIHIQDTRSTSSAFNFSMSMTDYQETSTLGTFDIVSTQVDVDAGAAVNAVGTSDCTTGITLGGSGSPFGIQDTDNDGTSNPESIMQGDTRIRVMECQMTPTIQISVPGSTSSGTYRSTVTWAIA